MVFQESRRKSYISGDKEQYKIEVLKELAYESEVFGKVLALALVTLQLSLELFHTSDAKYKMNRLCREQMQTSLKTINAQIDNEEQKKIGKFDEKALTREKTVEVLKYVEEKKLDVLS